MDPPLLKAVKEDKKFSYAHIYGNQLITYEPLWSNGQCLVIPQQVQFHAVYCTYSLLDHTVNARLTYTLNSHFLFPQMKSMIEEVIKKCLFCQKYKINH